MENLDGTVIATAMPQMARSFGASPVDLNIGMTAYLLALAVFIPISGWLADRFGARRVFAGAIGLFTASSVLCGLSNGLWEFTAARVLQGLGGAMMVPVGRLVVLRTTAKQDLLRSIAYITWPGLAAPILGPPVGGFITTYASWRWIFLLNVPLGLLGVVLAHWLIPNSRSSQKRPFDWIGFILISAACVSLMYGLDLIGRHEIHRLTTGLLLVCSLALGVAAVWHVRRHPHPLIDLSSLRVPTFAVTIWGGSLFRIAIGATPFLLPLMFQIGFGMNAFTSGLLVLSGLRRQSSNEACYHAGTPPLWISHGANCEWPACRGYDIRLRPILLVHAEGDHCRGAVCRWFISVDAVHQSQLGRLRRHPRVPNERREHPIEHDSTNDDLAWALPSARSPYAWPVRFIRQTAAR